MLYNFENTLFSRILRVIIFWLAIFCMFYLFAIIVRDESKPKQNQKIIEIDIKNKVNVCLPEEDESKNK